jgi:hypothetical protein
MSRLRITFAALTIFVMTSAGPAAAENVLRWASSAGALTFDPHAYDDTPTWQPPDLSRGAVYDPEGRLNKAPFRESVAMTALRSVAG